MKRFLGAMGLALALSLTACQRGGGGPAEKAPSGGGGGVASPMPSPGGADNMMTPQHAPTKAPGSTHGR